MEVDRDELSKLVSQGTDFAKEFQEIKRNWVLAQLALHNPHIWANSLKPVCFLCFLLFWCPLLPFIETGTLKIYTKMVLYMKNEIFDLKYPLHGV